jgi:hypothetical protein
MRVSSTLLLAVAAACVLPGARAEDPAKVDPSQQVNALNPSPDTTKAVDKVGIKHDDTLQGSRATLPGVIEEPKASIGDRTANIEMTEIHPKNIITRKEAAISTTPLPHQDSSLNGQMAPTGLQPNQNPFRGSTAVADKYQERLTDANSANLKLQPDLQRTTSFAQLNRFIFRRNGPGSDSGPGLVTAAGGGQASIPQTITPATPPAPSSETPGGSFEVLGVINAPGSALPATRP